MIPKFLLGWWFNKPILMNNDFEAVCTNSLFNVPRDNRAAINTLEQLDLLGVPQNPPEQKEFCINKVANISVDTNTIKFEGVAPNGNIKLSFEIPPNQYEARTLWGNFEESMKKWELSIQNRKMRDL